MLIKSLCHHAGHQVIRLIKLVLLIRSVIIDQFDHIGQINCFDQVLYNICAHHLVVVLMQEELIVFTFMLVLFQGLEKNSVKFCNFWNRCKDGILDILIIYICKNITLCSWSCSLVWLWMWSW